MVPSHEISSALANLRRRVIKSTTLVSRYLYILSFGSCGDGLVVQTCSNAAWICEYCVLDRKSTSDFLRGLGRSTRETVAFPGPDAVETALP